MQIVINSRKLVSFLKSEGKSLGKKFLFGNSLTSKVKKDKDASTQEPKPSFILRQGTITLGSCVRQSSQFKVRNWQGFGSCFKVLKKIPQIMKENENKIFQASCLIL